VVADSLLGVIRDGDVHSGIGIFHESPFAFVSKTICVRDAPAAAGRSLTGIYSRAVEGRGGYFHKPVFSKN
jgi:hypothetical protein